TQPRSERGADPCPSRASPDHHPFDSHNVNQHTHASRQARSASHTVNHGRYLLFESPAAWVQPRAPCYAVRRGGPATFTAGLHATRDIPSFLARSDDRLQTGKHQSWPDAGHIASWGLERAGSADAPRAPYLGESAILHSAVRAPHPASCALPAARRTGRRGPGLSASGSGCERQQNADRGCSAPTPAISLRTTNMAAVSLDRKSVRG